MLNKLVSLLLLQPQTLPATAVLQSQQKKSPSNTTAGGCIILSSCMNSLKI